MDFINIVRDSHFEEITEVKADAKNRITLGKGSAKTNIYKVYRNPLGQIILDPQVTIPAHEHWLFKNKKAASALTAGLKDAQAGKLIKSKENFSKYVKE